MPFKVLLRTLLFTFILYGGFILNADAQHDVMIQGFYWDVPVDADDKNGFWWDSLQSKATALRDIGITGIWVPSPAKGNFGIYDMGYGIFDLYDLGNYQQKGTTETRFGSRAELHNMIWAMHENDIEVYVDIVMNHLYTNEEQEENNPEVKRYVFDEARRNGKQYAPYPTNEIKWVLKDARPGKYHLEIHGYHLTKTDDFWNGYDLQVDFTGTGFSDRFTFAERTNRKSKISALRSGVIMRDTLSESKTFNSYSFDVRTTRDVLIRLTARKLTHDGKWEWSDQINGYYPKVVRYENSDIAKTERLEARTNTRLVPVQHTGKGEQNFRLNYSHFHPAHANDSLGYAGGDEIVPTTKLFGNDLNTYSVEVQKYYQDWGRWLVEEIGFDGFRLDWVRGFQEEYVSSWVKALPPSDKSRFVVGEYWGGAKAIQRWVSTLSHEEVFVKAFDFPLKFTLTEMCNNSGKDFDMTRLSTAGLISNADGFSLPDSAVVTFVENHDTGKEHDKWVAKDWHMAYAFMMMHPGRPCVFYNHLFGDTLTDAGDRSLKIVPDKTLGDEIRKLIALRNMYAYGQLQVLPETDRNVYIAKRNGEKEHPGCIFLLNNHDTETQSISIGSTERLQPGIYVNALDADIATTVSADGIGIFSVPARGYAVFVLKGDFQLIN
ncbi:MAG TPA: alpha-amylase family glycosyl hydrolase [Chryseosolibacter sp.]|nr:alpha-amylase family glycosyl hydrolase [Chryseosolibacter sp.]